MSGSGPGSLPDRFAAASTFDEYLGGVQKNRDLWHGVYDRVRLPEDLIEAGETLSGRFHFLALSEDWCGDAVNTLPVVARYADAVSSFDFRVLARDDNLDLMDAHLTNGRSRSIPIVIAYDEDFVERGWWGPRPAEIQAWVLGHLHIPSPERYKEVRRWYAKDRGRSTLKEILAVLNDPPG